MAIFAIVNQTSPVGKVKVEEFVEAADAAAAVTAYVNGYTPPKNPADFLGFDSGFPGPGITYPNAGFFWAYDFGAPGLVQEPFPVVGHKSLERTSIVSRAVSITLDGSWETLGVGVIAPGTFESDLTKMALCFSGSFKSQGPGPGPAGVPQVRIRENGTVIFGPVALGINVPNFVAASLIGDSPSAPGPSIYTFEGDLNGGVSAELQGVSIDLLLKLF